MGCLNGCSCGVLSGVVVCFIGCFMVCFYEVFWGVAEVWWRGVVGAGEEEEGCRVCVVLGRVVGCNGGFSAGAVGRCSRVC